MSVTTPQRVYLAGRHRGWTHDQAVSFALTAVQRISVKQIRAFTRWAKEQDTKIGKGEDQ